MGSFVLSNINDPLKQKSVQPKKDGRVKYFPITKRSESRASEVEDTNGKSSVLSTDKYNNHYLTMRAVNLKKMKRAGSCQSNNSSNP